MPKQEGEGHKTLAIRLSGEQHAQLTLLAQLDGVPLIEEIRQAIEAHIERKRSEGDFAARAQAALDEVEREASARREAIQAMFGRPPSEAPAPSPPKGRSRRGNGEPSS